MGFSSQEHWSELPFLPPGDLPGPRIEPASLLSLLHWQMDSLPLSHLGNPSLIISSIQIRATIEYPHSSVQFSSAQSCPTLCDLMNRSTPGLLVHHQLPKFTQAHIHRVRDAIQPSHLLSSTSPSALNPSQHQSLFQ